MYSEGAGTASYELGKRCEVKAGSRMNMTTWCEAAVERKANSILVTIREGAENKAVL